MKVPMMSALRFDGSGVEVADVRRARPATGQVLVRVTAVAIDRTDGEPHVGPHPLQVDPGGRRTLGRHVAGTVAAPGAGIDGWPLGRPVALQPETAVRRGWFVPGAEDEGGLAEYVAAPAEGLVLLPRDLPITVGAQLPLAARAGSMLTHAGLVPGESVGIWGAGALGAAALAVTRALGAAPVVVIEPVDHARVAARDLGADTVLDPTDPDLSDRLHELTGRHGLDVALHAAPDPCAAEQAVAALGPHGRVVLAGPAQRIGGIDRWDGRMVSGIPRVEPQVLPRLVHLLGRGRLRLPDPRPLPGGLPAAAAVLDAAVRGGPPVGPCVVTV